MGHMLSQNEFFEMISSADLKSLKFGFENMIFSAVLFTLLVNHRLSILKDITCSYLANKVVKTVFRSIIMATYNSPSKYISVSVKSAPNVMKMSAHIVYPSEIEK